jgi:hypothetical protein
MNILAALALLLCGASLASAETIQGRWKLRVTP